MSGPIPSSDGQAGLCLVQNPQDTEKVTSHTNKILLT